MADLHAIISVKHICAIVGVSFKMVYNTQKAVAGGTGTKRKFDWENKKQTLDLLNALQTKIAEDPTMSLHRVCRRWQMR